MTFCIKMGSDESHFNVSVGSDGQSHKTVSTDHNLKYDHVCKILITLAVKSFTVGQLRGKHNGEFA